MPKIEHDVKEKREIRIIVTQAKEKNKKIKMVKKNGPRKQMKQLQ